jgi:hypothetical protein
MSTENVAGIPRASNDLELTPAASEALELNTDLFRRQVLQELSRTHRRRGYRVRVSDVQVAADQVAAEGPRSVSVRLLTRLALILAFGTLFVQLLIGLNIADKAWTISAAALLTGISTGTATVLVVQEFRGRRKETSASMGFLWDVQALEWSARQTVKGILGPEAETASLARVLSALEILEVWTPEDSQVFRRLLFLRNSLVHEDSRVLSADDIGFGLSQASRLSDLLRRSHRTLKSKSAQVSSERAALIRRAASVYEERVANALREASFRVLGAQGDYGYDLLTDTPIGSLAIVIRYQSEGLIGKVDLERIDQRQLPDIPVVLVANVRLSLEAERYLGSPDSSHKVTVVVWRESESDKSLIESISRAAGIS